MPDDRSLWPHIAESLDIQEWANRVIAPSELPVLIRRLIREDNDQVVKLEMPGYEGVNSPGFDGFVVAKKGSLLVPEGVSIWEVGTSADPRRKAEEDFVERTLRPRNCIPEETTFVFVTPRRWKGKAKWQAEKEDLKIWKGVKVFDVDNLLTVLENAPGIHYWLSGAIGKYAGGIQTLDDWWNRFSNNSSPALNISDILAGRDDEAATLVKMIETDRSRIVIKVKSVDDLMSFMAAAILALPQDEQDRILMRTLIIKDLPTLRQIDGSWSHLTLIPFSEDLYRESEQVVLNSVIRADPDALSPDLVVPPISAKPLEKSLVEGGIPIDEARTLSRAASKSVKSFMRLTSGNPVVESTWSTTFSSHKMRVLWLLGAWNADRTEDIELIERLINSEWAVIEDILRADVQSVDPIFSVAGDFWAVRDLSDTGRLLITKISSADLQVIEQAIQVIFGFIDLNHETPEDDPWLTGMNGKQRIHSKQLRNGLAEVLAFLGASGERKILSNGLTLSGWTKRLVSKVLLRANADQSGEIWESLNDVLPMLAEAAPEEFLLSVGKGLDSSLSFTKSLFADSNSNQSYSISSPHIQLLDALETLSWNTEYLSTVANVLSTLAEIDPGGTLSNRPANSLTSIFQTWLPQTSAPLRRRISVLDEILARHPKIGWKLLLSLLPTNYAMSFTSNGPRFHKWKPECQSAPSRQEYGEMLAHVRRRVVECVGGDSERWPELIQRLDCFAGEDLQEILQGLSTYSNSEPDEAKRFAIYDALNDFIRKHREFPDAVWSMPADLLAEIEKASQQFTPASAALRSKWLFESQRPDLGMAFAEDDAPYQDKLAQLRKTACIEMYIENGLNEVLGLARSVEFPFDVGRAFATSESGETPEVIASYLDSEERSEVAFAAGSLWLLAPSVEEVKSIVDKYPDRPEVIARLLLQSQDLKTIWGIAHEQGSDVEDRYWREFQVYGRGERFELVNECARHLVDHGLLVPAIHLLSLYAGREGISVDADLTFTALDLFSNRTDRGVSASHPSSWELGRLLKYIQMLGISDERIVILEWKLLSDLGYGYKPSSIENTLARDPEFFVEILSLVYRSDVDEEQRHIDPIASRNAFHALNEWSRLPGSSDDGVTIDSEALSDWLARASELLAKAGRLEVGENVIGQLLARADVKEGEAWPPIAVRDVLESSQSESRHRGFMVGIFNLRGVYSRGMDEGGRQEYELAEKFERWKNQMGGSYSVSAGLLQRVADNYREEGRQEDEKLKRRDEGFGDD